MSSLAMNSTLGRARPANSAEDAAAVNVAHQVRQITIVFIRWFLIFICSGRSCYLSNVLIAGGHGDDAIHRTVSRTTLYWAKYDLSRFVDEALPN